MLDKITELLKKPVSLKTKQREREDRIDEMSYIKDTLKQDNMYISVGHYPIVTPTPEFKKTINEYLNNRLVELAKEVQILQGVTPIEYKESEEK